MSVPYPGGWFDAHDAAVVDAAAARLVPGPADDPAETDPGAREAGALEYIDGLLAQGDAERPAVWRHGPTSDRAGGDVNHLREPAPMRAAEVAAWRQRIADWRHRYAAGVVLLDRLAGGDFAQLAPHEQDRVLADDQVAGFRDLLFGHVVEAMYAVPEHGGNRNLVGWRSVGFAGDVQPRGFDAALVPTGRPDPLDPDLRDAVLAILPLPLVEDDS